MRHLRRISANDLKNSKVAHLFCEILKFVRFAIVCFAFVASFYLLLIDPPKINDFLISKALAFVSIALTIFLAYYWDKKNLFPQQLL